MNEKEIIIRTNVTLVGHVASELAPCSLDGGSSSSSRTHRLPSVSIKLLWMIRASTMG